MVSDDAKYYEALREMFATDGWRIFMSEVEAAIMSARIENLKDANEFWVSKGELSQLHKILGYENMVKAAEEQAEEDAETA